MNLKRLLISLVVISATSASLVGLTSAFFNDTETSHGNTLAAGKLDLKINGTDNPQAIVNIGDLKPGDDRDVEKHIEVIDNPAFVWIHLKDVQTDPGTLTEPERVEEEADGEKHDIDKFISYDLEINGETLIDEGDNVNFNDAVSCWIPLGQIPGATDITMHQSFHFDKDVTNWAQGDLLTFTEEFYATQVRNNPNPSPPDLNDGRIWDPEVKHCIDCTPGATWASSAVSLDQGLTKGGSAVAAARSIPESAVGLPDAGTNPDHGFVSLGIGGEIVLKFKYPVQDKDGADLSFHEVTNGRANYPEESAEVYASQDNSTWFDLGKITNHDSGNGISLVDIAGKLPEVNYVKIVDTTDPNLHVNSADGYDLDAVDATYGTCTQF